MEKVLEILHSLSDEDIVSLCDSIRTGTVGKETDTLSLHLTTVLSTPQHVKQNEMSMLLDGKHEMTLSLILYTIEDWKNTVNVNRIRFLLLLDALDKKTFHEIVGHQSKKTVGDGTIIDVASLAVKKMCNEEYQRYSTSFYTRLDGIRLQCNYSINKGIDNMLKQIQSEIACRSKYESHTLEEHKHKLLDSIETRTIEAELFALFYKNRYKQLISVPGHTALHFILYHTWSETKEMYPWLTHLMTYINNSSAESKTYLMKHLDIRHFKNKQDLIIQTAQKVRLNIKYSNEIINFVFDIGNSFKHGTYIKWYRKELDLITLFEQYQDQTIQQYFTSMIDSLFEQNENDNVKQNVLDMMMEHYMNMMRMFP